jgi:hypothetical protein
MHFSFRPMAAALTLVALCAGATVARAGDDGAAPLWVGVGSIFTPLLGATDIGGLVGLGAKEEKPQIEYREHGKLVVPKSTDLPPPGAPGEIVSSNGGAWPVNQETQRRKARKEAEHKRALANNNGDIRVKASQGFPNAPVTTRAADQEGPLPGACPNDKCRSTGSSVLSALNPLGWMGMGGDKNSAPPPEPDREWLTDPPKGYRQPAGASAN